jgi:TrmH RNA methyltransferase
VSSTDEQTVYGIKAGLALLEHRPQALVRLYHAPALRGRLRGVLSQVAARRLPYRELDGEALRKVAGSPHHEGLVVVARPLRYRPFGTAEAAAGEGGAPWLALDRVENPHNLGAILRSAAFFGVAGLLAGGHPPGEKVNAAVIRVAEGGAEHLPLFAAPDLGGALGLLREAGRPVIGLETDTPGTLAAALAERLPADGAGGRAPVLVLGGEREGLSQAVRRACDRLCRLQGRGALTSLNVSVAAGVALAELTRGLPPPTGAAAPAASGATPSGGPAGAPPPQPPDGASCRGVRPPRRPAGRPARKDPHPPPTARPRR